MTWNDRPTRRLVAPGSRRAGGRRHDLALTLLVLTLLLMLAAMPAAAVAPGPVIPVDEAPSGDGESSEDVESAPEYADDPACLLPAAAAANAGRLLSYPGPVIPVDGQDLPPCRSELALSLIVISEADDDPQGADASFDSQTVSRVTLESGFATELLARTRTIELSDPGADWKVMDVACTCAAGTGAPASASQGDRSAPLGRLTSYPGPVIPVDRNEPPGARQGSARCPSLPSASTSGADIVATSRAPVARPGAGLDPLGGRGARSLQPGPVIPVEMGDQEPAPEPTPEPPAREPGLVEWFPGGDVFIYDPDGAGGSFSCIWTVEHGRGRLSIETKTEPAGREARFSYRADPRIPGLRTETIPGSSSGDRTMWKGTWSLRLEKPSDAWELESSECSDADDTTPSSAQGEAAVVGMDPGDRVSCTYELKLLAPREGRWRSREPAARLTCGGASFRIPAIRDAGTIRVRDDGMRLVARGLSSGDAVWRLDRQGEDSLRYAGTIQRNLDGARGRFDLVLDLIDEERMEGTFEGTIRVRGQRCSVSKSITLRHAGS